MAIRLASVDWFSSPPFDGHRRGSIAVKWYFVWRMEYGTNMEMHGVYRDLTPPERIMSTHANLAAEALRINCTEHQMKKALPKARANAVEGKPAESDVDSYLTQIPEPARGTLNKIRATIRAIVPAESTEGISYGVPAFKYKGVLVGYAAFPDHCSFFPMSPPLIEEFKDDLKKFSTSKGTIRFSVDKPLSAILIKKIVKARIAENERRQKK
jgi:uncharacterized protein YdhG (YjbR/CyaY superfamily)